MDGRSAWVKVVVAMAFAGMAATLAAMTTLAEASPTPTPQSSPSPTFPSASISLSSTSGPVGSSTTVVGNGFPSNATLAIYVDQPNPYVASPARLNAGGPQTDSQGAFQLVIAVPDESYGSHNVCADTGYPGSAEPYAVRACNQFAVQATLTISVSAGPPGTPFTLTGTGFPAGEYVAIYPDTTGTNGPFLGTPGPQADGVGRFSEGLGWPTSPMGFPQDPSTPGVHLLCGDTGIGGSSQAVVVKACAQFVVSSLSPTLVLTPTSGPIGVLLIIKGSGFVPSISYTVTVDGTLLLCSTNPNEFRADKAGNFETQVVIQPQMHFIQCPPIAPVVMSNGRHSICGQTGSTVACANFTFLGSATPTANQTVAGSNPPSWRLPLAAAALVFLIVFAGTAIVWATRARKPPTLPPIR